MIALTLPAAALAQQSSSLPKLAIKDPATAEPEAARDVTIRWSQIQEKAKTFQANRSGSLMSPGVSKPQERKMRFKQALEKVSKSN